MLFLSACGDPYDGRLINVRQPNYDVAMPTSIPLPQVTRPTPVRLSAF